MRKLFTSMLFTTALALVSFGASVHMAADAQEKKAPDKVSAAEIEKLINDLGSDVFATRQRATKKLRQTPGANVFLRRVLRDSILNLENRRRLEELVGEIAKAGFKRRFQELVREKSDAPLDLLVDLLLENRHYVGADEWQGTLEVLNGITKKLSHGIKDTYAPISQCDFRKCEQVIGTNLSMEDPPRFRVIADRLVAGRLMNGSIVVLSETVNFGGSHMQNVLLMRGEILKARDATNKIGGVTGCFVFTGGDFTCSSSYGSIVVAGGRIEIADPENSVLIPNARQSSAVKWFTTQRVGLTLAQDRTNLRVQNVVPGSTADIGGIQSGDQIRVDDGQVNALRDLESRIRRSFAGQTEIELSITRDGQLKKCVLSFCD